MPFQLVNDSTIVEIAGIHTNTTWIAVGTPTMIHSTTLSRRDRLEKCRRLARARSAARAICAASASEIPGGRPGEVAIGERRRLVTCPPTPAVARA